MDTVKGASADRDSSYRALVRDVIFGTVAVILLSLAVPAWIIRAEYRKEYREPVKLAPVAEVLRERTSRTAVIPPHVPHILELAERLVRQEAEKREAAQREAAQRETTRRESERHTTAARPAPAVPPVVSTPQFDARESIQAP